MNKVHKEKSNFVFNGEKDGLKSHIFKFQHVILSRFDSNLVLDLNYSYNELF